MCADGYFSHFNDARNVQTAADGSGRAGLPRMCRVFPAGRNQRVSPSVQGKRRLPTPRAREEAFTRRDDSRFAAERDSFEGAVRAPLRPEQRKRAARRLPSTADHRPRQFWHQQYAPKASIKEHSLDSAHNYGPVVTRECSKQRNKLSTPSRSRSPGNHNPREVTREERARRRGLHKN